MHRDGKFSDNGRTRQKFGCPFMRTSHLHDCQHKNFHKGRSATGCCKYVTVPNDYRLSYSRDTAQFKKLYALRTECEHYNSRFKATGQERLWVRSFTAATNLNSIAHIALLAIALAAVSCKKKQSVPFAQVFKAFDLIWSIKYLAVVLVFGKGLVWYNFFEGLPPLIRLGTSLRAKF